MMPALHTYVLKRQVPFEFFAKCWGKMVEGFLEKLASVLDLSEPSDLVWYVTKKKYIPGRRAELGQACNTLYISQPNHSMFSNELPYKTHLFIILYACLT